ncbi:MAG: helix-turn-helix transcriptional regulator [Desulfuromonadales bacterium]
MSDFFDQWAEQSPENAKLLAQELLITEVTELIWKAMEESGITKSELAGRMQATKGYVSQLLNGSRNMTLRTLADICFALGSRPVFNFGSEAANSWHEAPQKIHLHTERLRYARSGNLITPLEHWMAA